LTVAPRRARLGRSTIEILETDENRAQERQELRNDENYRTKTRKESDIDMTRFPARTYGARLSALVAGSILVVASVTTAAALDRSLTDRDIRDALEDEMSFDGNVPFDAIDVSVDNGVATLTGQVRSLLAKDRCGSRESSRASAPSWTASK
jgi:hypothetical protein